MSLASNFLEMGKARANGRAAGFGDHSALIVAFCPTCEKGTTHLNLKYQKANNGWWSWTRCSICLREYEYEFAIERTLA